MKRITNLAPGGDALVDELEKVEISGKRGSISETSSIGKRGSISELQHSSGSKRGSISEDRILAQQKRRTSSSGSSPPLSRSGSKKMTRNGSTKKGVTQPIIRDKNTLHDAYYKMIEAYATETIVESQ